MPILGQNRLREELSRYSSSNLPKTILFIGPTGCGKTLFAIDLAERLGIEYINVDSAVSHDTLVEYMQSPIRTLYIINISDFTQSQQNKLLKFIEEPSQYMTVCIKAESENSVLPTILNRCKRFRFDPYTPAELKENFGWTISDGDNDLIYKVCNTPGQLSDLSLSKKSIEDMFEFCTMIVDKINIASYSNTMTLIGKINYKDDYDKLDFELFFKTLKYVASQKYIKERDEISFKILNLVNKYIEKKFDLPINKENFMINFISNLWMEVHDEN